MRRKSVRRSLPGVIVEDGMLNHDDVGRGCLSLDNSPQPVDQLEEERQPQPQQQPQEQEQKEQREHGVRVLTEEIFRAPGLVKHESLPSLHLNARCLKCDAIGTVYCKGCEAHFCAKHDRRRHRFLIRKTRHEHKPVPGISYFRIPLPNAGDESHSSDDIDEEQSPEPPPVGRRGLISALRPQEVRVDLNGGGGGGGGTGGAEENATVLGRRGRAGSGKGRGARWADARSLPKRSKSKSAIDLARSGWYNKIVSAIVRPPRCKYSMMDLGDELTPVSSCLAMKRRDFEVRNQRGLKLVCSQWRPAFTEDTSKLPCVVYLHGNSSARVDVVKTSSLRVLGTVACTVVSFDFSGSGMSEGDFVTLGYFEQHDVADVLAYLRSNGMASRYVLWGRSMGAASALLYAARYPNSDLCGLILDSPFSSFGRLAKDLVTQGQINVPGFLVNGALGLLRHSVRKRTRCDLKTVAPIARAKNIRCPCLFIAARKDVMIRPSHGADLSEAVGGASLFISCKGGHNTARPGIVLQAVGTFVKGCLQAPGVPIAEAFSVIQAALLEAQATASALKANRISSISSSHSKFTSAAVTRSVSDALVMNELRPRRPSDRGGDKGGESGPRIARPPAVPGPRRGRKAERSPRTSSCTSSSADARMSLGSEPESAGTDQPRTNSLRDTNRGQRSKSHNGDNHRRRGSRRRGRESDGSSVLEVGSACHGLVANGGLGADEEFHARSVNFWRPGSGGQSEIRDGAGCDRVGVSSVIGLFPTKLEEHSFPHRRNAERKSDTLGEALGDTGELSPYPSPKPPVATAATTLSFSVGGRQAVGAGSGFSRGAAAASTSNTAVQRKASSLNPASGNSKGRVVSLLFPTRPPEPTESLMGGGTTRGSAGASASAMGASIDYPSLGAQDRPMPSGSTGNNSSVARGATAAAGPASKNSLGSSSRGGSGWLKRIGSKTPVLSAFRQGSRAIARGGATGGVRSFDLDRSSGGRVDGAVAGTKVSVHVGAPAEAFGFVDGLPPRSKRDKLLSRPEPIRTASGKLKM